MRLARAQPDAPGRRDRRSLAAVGMLVLASCGASVRADVVAPRGRPPLVNTQVLRLAEGRLLCGGDQGRETGFPIEQVDYLQITGWQMFNLAEQQRRVGNWQRAAVSYERVLGDLEHPETATTPDAGVQAGPSAQADALDRQLLVQCRLILAWDAQSRFDRAVELYIEVLERMPAVVDALRPTSFPETGSAVLEAAAAHVDAAILRHGETALAQSLRKWRETWPVRPTATGVHGGADALAGRLDRRDRERVEAVAALVQAGQSAEALARIAQLHEDVRGLWRAGLFYWQGRAFESQVSVTAAPNEAGRPESMAATSPTSMPASAGHDADALTARAGLAYMRVVVHFPRHPLAAESLYRAVVLCRRTGRHEQAAALASELIAVYPQARSADGQLLADLAREELK